MRVNLLGPATILIGVILLILLIGLIYVWLYIAKKQNVLHYIGSGEMLREQRKTLRERLWAPVLKAAVYVGPTAVKYPLFVNQQRDERVLMLAGNPFGLTLTHFYGMRYVLGFSALLVFWGYAMLGLPFGTVFLLVFTPLGFFFPNLWLWYLSKERQEIISATMPDFLDTVSIALQAGVSMDGALRHVAGQMKGPLSEEIQRFNQEIALGVERRTALANLANRNNAKELEMLVHSLIQGIELGVSVATTFRVQAENLRSTRVYRAKEKAAKASPKITLVTTFFVAPAVFLLIVGLMVLNIIYNPASFGFDVLFK